MNDPSAEWAPLPDDGRGVSAVMNVVRLAGFGAVLAAFTVPALGLLALGRDPARVRAGWLRTGARVELSVLGIELEVEGAERLDQAGPLILMANHGSLLDVFLFGALLRRPARALLRLEFARIPLLGAVLTRSGHVLFDRESPRAAARAFETAAAALTQGDAVLVFPEGRRFPHGTLGPFKQGAFRLAVRSGAPVLPITVLNGAALLPPGTRALRPGVVRIVVGEPIETSGWTMPTLEAHVRQVRAAIAAPLARYRDEILRT